jgi:hypothetical protein
MHPPPAKNIFHSGMVKSLLAVQMGPNISNKKTNAV